MNGFGSYEMDARGRSCYRPPLPLLPPLDDIWDQLSKAIAAVNGFDQALDAFPAAIVVGRLFARLDAVHSSGAEGSTTTFTDLLSFETTLRQAPDPKDAASVAGCAEAFDQLSESSYAQLVQVTAEIHKRLFERHPDPLIAAGAGHWKHLSNGTFDSDLGDIFYYTRPESLWAALHSWNELTTVENGNASYPALARAAVSHWVFEHIHPFPDGNGRVGRLIVPLIVRWQGGSRRACAFMGEAVHHNKQIYVDALKAGRRTGDMAAWTRVCLAMIAQTAAANLERLSQLGQILERWRMATSTFRSHSIIHDLVPFALTKPVFTIKDALQGVAQTAGRGTFVSVNAAVGHLVERGILEIQEKSERGGPPMRDRLFIAPEVLALFEWNAPQPAPDATEGKDIATPIRPPYSITR